MNAMKARGLKGLMAIGLIVTMHAVTIPVVAAPIYSDVDVNGRRTFSDEKKGSSREVTLQEGTIVSGAELGKQVTYKYGAPDKGSRQHGKHPQLRALEKMEKKCAGMRDFMNSTAGVKKIQMEERYNRECVLGQ